MFAHVDVTEQWLIDRWIVHGKMIFEKMLRIRGSLLDCPKNIFPKNASLGFGDKEDSLLEFVMISGLETCQHVSES